MKRTQPKGFPARIASQEQAEHRRGAGYKHVQFAWEAITGLAAKK